MPKRLKLEHTTGQWHYGDLSAVVYSTAAPPQANGNTYRMIADLSERDDADRNADARLIVAAPALLQLAREVADDPGSLCQGAALAILRALGDR